MRVIVQRVREARVEVEGHVVGAISGGLLGLAAVEEGDTEAQLAWAAGKLVGLRIFPDETGKMNRSVIDVGGGVLLVSNFTVAGDCRKGRRPSFEGAMKPPEAAAMFDRFVELVRGMGVDVATGSFGASMAVSLVNDGPVTLVIENP
jgi:D-aminoacyl-tRNA deacylase